MNTEIYHFELDEIDFSKSDFIQNYLFFKLGHLTHDYTVLSANVVLTKENKYALIAVIQIQ